MGKVFIVDVAKCTGCYNCQLVCKDEHCGNDWEPYAAPQPETGHFWCRLDEHPRGTIPRVKIHYIAHICGHCDNPVCANAAKNDAVYKRDDGLVIIDPEKAKGQKEIVDACPYGAIYWNDELELPQKCTGCAHLLDHGAKLPRCVDACPTDALMFGEEEDYAEIIKDATVFNPESGASPNMYYLNIPGRWIGGTVYDPDIKEVIIGAKVKLTCKNGTCTCTDGKCEEDTNDFGDFWFKNLDETIFDITIEAEGYETKEYKDLDTSNDINLKDIPMKKLDK